VVAIVDRSIFFVFIWKRLYRSKRLNSDVVISAEEVMKVT
jgi:hypothetical protein